MFANYYGGYGEGNAVFDMDRVPGYVEGVEVRGRLAVVYSARDYRDLWSGRIEYGLLASPGAEWNPQCLGNRFSSEAGLRLGVNAVVYALTQEGSLAQRYVAER